MILRLIGLPGSGKSVLRLALADAMGWPDFDITDMPGHRRDARAAWAELAARVDAQPDAIVESSGWTRMEQAFYASRDRITIVVSAPPITRWTRLMSRPEVHREPGYARRLASYRPPPVSGDVIRWSGLQAPSGAPFSGLLSRIGQPR